MVSGLTFKFLIFFELIFMYKNHEMVMMSLVRWWSSFFFFFFFFAHMAVQFSQHHLLK